MIFWDSGKKLKILKLVLLAIFLLVISPITLLTLIPPPAQSHWRIGEFDTAGVLLERVVYKNTPSIALEYEPNIFRDWGGMARSIFGIAGDTNGATALIVNSNFTNGVIEVDIASEVVVNMLGLSRGFAGIAFRVSDDLASYEQVYLRPANGRSNNAIQRSHAVQYAAHPNFHFDVSRREFPGEYETGADIGLDEWMKLRIEVDAGVALIYVNGEFALKVDSLKLGAHRSGGIAFWVGMGSRAYFSNLKLTPKDK